MNLDPRLRLLGASTLTPAAEHVLQLLDSTQVTIVAGSDVPPACDTSIIALTALASRLFGHATVQPRRALTANWWGITDSADLTDALAGVRVHTTTPATIHINVVLGTTSTLDADGLSFWIGGGDYTVRLAREAQPLDATITHGLGLHAAACLVISQLLTHVLEPAGGFAGLKLTEPYVTNLIDYSLSPAELPEQPEPHDEAAVPALNVVFAGVGSVGTSALALLAQAVAPALTPGPIRGRALGEVVTIDKDAFDPSRNPYRYPALLGREDSAKAAFMSESLTALGLPTRAHTDDVASWVQAQDSPGLDGLLVSSVDTLTGRLDVTDVLARETLSLGVDGLALHAQRERFADGLACPYCDYVSADPPMTQADVNAALTGLTVARILALAQPEATLTEEDVDAAIAAGKVAPDRRQALVGSSLTDLIRQAYAEIELRGPDVAEPDRFTLAAPHVSWFAGVLAAVEIVKQLRGLPTVDRRVDVDLRGLPQGVVRRMPADTLGRCVCHGRRALWYRSLYSDTSSNH